MHLQEQNKENGEVNTQPPHRAERAIAEEYFEQYWKYASAVRNWYVIYGVGGIALLFTKDNVFGAIDFKMRVKILIAFIAAVLAQVLVSLFRKWVHWGIYSGKEHNLSGKQWYLLAVRLSRWIWLDILCDLVSLVAFGYASYLLILALGPK